MKHKMTRTLLGTLAFAFAALFSSSAWAATDLKTTVSGGSFTINNVNAAAFDHCTQTVSSPTLTIPASTDLPAGTKVAITTISLGKRQTNPGTTVVPDKIRITVGTTDYTSASKTEDTDTFVSEASSGNTALKQKYSFDGTGCILVVGETYNIKLLNSSGGEISGNNVLNVRVVKNSASLFGSTIQAYINPNTWTPVQEITGDIIHTATLASDGTMSDFSPALNEGSKRFWINVPETASYDISTFACSAIYFNVGSDATLNLSGTVTATAGIYVYGGEIAVTAAPTFTGTVKGDGTLYYNGVRPTTSGTDVVLTDSDWRGTVRVTYNYANTASGTARALFPQHWGSANSKIKWNGVCGYFGGSTSAARWILEDLTANAKTYPALRKNDGGSSAVTTAPSLEGDGEFCDASNPTERFLFADGSNFDGAITITSASGKGMNVQFGSSARDVSARTINVRTDASVTVASGKTWRADGGIVVSGTLTLEDSTSALSGTVSGSGTLVCGGTENVPDIASLTQSGWTGTVEVSGAATMQTMAGSASTQFMNSGSTLKVTSGYAALTSAAGLTGKVSVNSGAALYVMDSTTTELSFGLGTVDGSVNISGCSALTTLTIDVGTERSISPSKLQLPSSATLATVNVVVGETHGAGGAIELASTAGIPAVEGRTYNYLVKREDGATVSATLADGVLTYAPAISGAATMYDATFLNTTAFAYKRTSGANIGLDDALDPKYNNALNDATTGIYLRHHPYVNGAASDIHGLTDFSLVVVGQMSPTHKTQFIHLGSTLNSNKGLLIATTEHNDEVIIAPNSGKTVDTSNAVTVSVPNAASARHAYVIIKSGNTFTVWVDGIKRGNFTVAEGWSIGSSSHAGVQVGSDFGGEIQRSSDANKYASVANSLDETGVVNVIRIFDYILSDAQAQAIVAAYPYVSEGGLYTRTISAAANLSAADAWAKDGSATTYALPEGATVDEVYYAPSATVTVSADATLTANADLTIDTLTVGGSGTLSVVSDGSHAVTVSGAAVVNSPLSIAYGAVNLAGTPVQLGSGGTLAFDCSGIDLSEVYATRHYQLTGLMDRDDEKVTVTLPAAPLGRSVAKAYNANGYYEMIVTSDHAAGSDIYYTGGYWGTTESTFAVVNADGATTAVFPGDTVVIDSHATGENASVAYFGTTLPANVSAIRVAKDYTFEPGDTGAILGGATVSVADGCTLSFGATWRGLNIGAVTLNGSGGVSIPSGLANTVSVSGVVSGTAPLTVNGTVAVIGGSIANTLSGSGVLGFMAVPAATPAGFSSWTGTVVLPAITSGEVNLNRYGVAGSTVQVGGISGGAWLSNVEVAPTIDLTGNVTLGAFSATFANTIDKLTGSGNFSLTADGSTEGYEDGYFLIKDVSGYTGTFTVNRPGLAIGDAKPSTTGYGNIAVTGTLKGSCTLASATVFADGATLDATAGTPTLPASITYDGALEVKVSSEPTTTAAKIANTASTSLPAAANVTITVSGSPAVATLTTGEGGIYVVKPSLDESVAEVVTDTGIQAAIAKAAAKAGVATVTTIGADYVPDVAALFYDSIVVADSEVNTTDYAFGISGLTVVSATVDASTDFYVVVTATAEGLTDGATIALKSGSESANAAEVKSQKGYSADQTTAGTTTTKIFVLDMPSGTGSFSYEVTVSK